MAIRGHLPVVKLRIGGRTYRFGIDSGASVNVLDARILARLPRALCQPVGTQQLQGVAQQPLAVPTVLVHDLVIDGHTAPPTRAAVADLSAYRQAHGTRLDGILGRPFLLQHRVTLDYPAGRLVLD